MDLCKYVNPFYGNFEPELPEPNEIASKWFFLKAQVGNTTPAAVRPFGMVSACAYTGGYPTGYGPYLPNSHGRPKTFLDKQAISALGFSHFHQSGTGYIGEFYNYSVVTPVSGKEHKRFARFPLTREEASPGYYGCTLGDVSCHVTVTKTGAVYEFEFPGEDNTVVFDPVLNGIFMNEAKPFSPLGSLELAELEGNTVTTTVLFENGVRLYTSLMCDGRGIEVTKDNRVVFSVNGNRASVRVGFSFASAKKAKGNLSAASEVNFADVKAQGESQWNKALSKIVVEADEKQKTKFYSNLYHSLIKPIGLGEDNGFSIEGECYCDIATLWDITKTQLPLIFTLFDDTSTKITASFINSFKCFGVFPNCLLLSGCNGSCDDQARALAVNSIYDAYLRGVKGIDWDEALSCMVAELQRESNRAFHEGKQVSSFASHTIDLSIAAYSVSCLAKALGKEDVAEKYLKLSENWSIVYDKKTGVVSENSKFYEGCNLNYSFRLLPNMERRVEVAGGKERFESSLDEFFGFNKQPAVQCLKEGDRATMKAGEDRHDFEGFNNETDMETPYCYCYIGRRDKTCQIVRSGEKYMYGADGRGALCGNEDSGAMSSLYVVNALGLFPCFGQNRVILGSPSVQGAELSLANGNRLTVTAEGFDENRFVPERIFFNGKELEEPFITVTELMQGGEIRFLF